MKYLVLLFCMILTSRAQGNEWLFRCQSSLSIFNPSFEQGSEIYMDILWDKESQRLSIINIPAVGKPIEILKAEENSRLWNEPELRLYSQWDHGSHAPYLSMFRYSETGWGMALHLSDLTRQRSSDLSETHEVELHCKQMAQWPESLSLTKF